MDTTKTKSVSELQAQIETVTSNQRKAAQSIDTLRAERARLILGKDKSNRVSLIDKEVNQLRVAIDNFPTELSLLEQNLSTENERLAQVERDNLREQQEIVAREIESLSVKFIESLKKANGISEQLLPAITAEANLAKQTNQQVLENYCNPSEGSLSMLLETCEAEMSGQPANLRGEASKNVRMRL